MPNEMREANLSSAGWTSPRPSIYRGVHDRGAKVQPYMKDPGGPSTNRHYRRESFSNEPMVANVRMVQLDELVPHENKGILDLLKYQKRKVKLSRKGKLTSLFLSSLPPTSSKCFSHGAKAGNPGHAHFHNFSPEPSRRLKDSGA